jgi:hypothetical protein
MPTLQISFGIISLFEKTYYRKPMLTLISNIEEDCTILLFQLSVRFEKCVAARHYADIGIEIFLSNDRNRVR